jgi:hypothetical protein
MLVLDCCDELNGERKERANGEKKIIFGDEGVRHWLILCGRQKYMKEQ